MACPKCGGKERRQLAPGYWECQSSVLVPGMVPAPTGALVPGPANGTCGHRYQDGTGRVSDAQCECGTFAIGICKRCGRAVCGDHSLVEDGVRLCPACSRAAASERKAAREREVEAAKEEGRRTLARFLEVAAATGNPGAKPVWLEPRSICADELGRRYCRERQKLPRIREELLSERKRRRWKEVQDAAWSEYTHKRTPVGYGWLFKNGRPELAPGARWAIKGDTGREELPWYPLVLTTGEIRACRSVDGGVNGRWRWIGFPLVSRPDSESGRFVCGDLAAKLADENFYGLFHLGGSLSADVIRARAASLGIDLT